MISSKQKMRNQKGFATLEIILIMVIISALAGEVVPKMARIVDVSTLNYEVKKFQSEFFFARSLSRVVNFDRSVFNIVGKEKAIAFKVDEKNYHIERNGNWIREKNFLPSGFSISAPNNLRDVSFDSFGKSGKSGTYIFISPMKNKRSLKLDSVGRLQIDDKN